MTQRQAETVANVMLTAAAVGVAYYVLRTPPLRRLAFRLTTLWARGPLAIWAATEVRRAWDASGRPTLAD
jgi:apolipoprotein N-acyltransferase